MTNEEGKKLEEYGEKCKLVRVAKYNKLKFCF